MAQCDVPDKLAMFSYLTQIYEALRGVSPHVKHPKYVSNCKNKKHVRKSEITSRDNLSFVYCLKKQETEMQDHATHPKQLKQLSPEEKITRKHSRSRHSGENAKLYVDKENTISRRCRKRRSIEKVNAAVSKTNFLSRCSFYRLIAVYNVKSSITVVFYIYLSDPHVSTENKTRTLSK